MFQLTKLELEDLRSKNSTTNLNPKSRTLPHAFTEQGIYMLATVLRGKLAEQQSIFIVRSFREMRHYIRENHQFATQEEMHLVNARVSEISVQVASMADRQKQTEKEVRGIQHSIDQINKNFVSEKDFKNFVIYKGCAINKLENNALIHQVIDKLLKEPEKQILRNHNLWHYMLYEKNRTA